MIARAFPEMPWPPPTIGGRRRRSTHDVQSAPPQILTVNNAGAAPLVISRIYNQSAGDFTEEDNCSGTTLAPGGSCTINVAFTDYHGGESTALQVITNDSSSQNTVKLVGRKGE